MSFDLPFSLYLQEHLRNPFLDKVFIFFTRLGDGGIFWIIFILVLLCFKKTRFAGFVCLLAVVIDYLTVGLIKTLVGRLRPFQTFDLDLIIKAPSGSSFPSAHASIAFSAATAFFLTAKEKVLAILRWVILFTAFVIAFSRVYLFVHYLTDILAGALIGIVIGLIVVKFSLKYEERIKKMLKLPN